MSKTEKRSETPRCWNCRNLSYVYYTGRFSCDKRGIGMPRRLINQYPITDCPCHEFCSAAGITKRQAAGWHLVPSRDEEMNRFAPKRSYLQRRVNPGRSLKRSKAVTFKGTEATVDRNPAV